MRNLRGLFIVFAGLAVMMALAGAGPAVWATSEGFMGLVKLQDVMNEPERYCGAEVEFYCRFATVGRLFRQNDSQVAPQTHLNLAVWNPEAPLWNKEARKGALPTLYLPQKKAVECSAVGKLNMYSRIKVRGRVYGVYAKLPWIEVVSLKPAFDGKMDADLLSQVSEAVSSCEKGYTARAGNIFRAVSTQNCPEFIREFSKSELLKCREKMSVSVDAIKSDVNMASSNTAMSEVNEALRRNDWRGVYEAFLASGAEIRKDPQMEKALCSFMRLLARSEAEGKVDPAYMAKSIAMLGKFAAGLDSKSEAHYELAKLYGLFGLLEESEERLRAFLHNNPNHAAAGKALADIMAKGIALAVVPVIETVRPEKSVEQKISDASALYAAGKYADSCSLYKEIDGLAKNLDAEQKRQVTMGIVGCLVALKKNTEAQNYINAMMNSRAQVEKTEADAGVKDISTGGRDMGRVNQVEGIATTSPALSEFEELPSGIDAIAPISKDAKADDYVEQSVEKMPDIQEISRVPVSEVAEVVEMKAPVAAEVKIEPVKPVQKVAPAPAVLPAKQTAPKAGKKASDLPDWAM